MAKLPHTSQTAMAVTFLVINLSTLLRQVLWIFLGSFQKRTHFLLLSVFSINKNYVFADCSNKNLSSQLA
jgi:hypothetical protein